MNACSRGSVLIAWSRCTQGSESEDSYQWPCCSSLLKNFVTSLKYRVARIWEDLCRFVKPSPTIADRARWSLSKFSASIVSEVGFQGFEDKQGELGFAAQVAHLTGIWCRTNTSVKQVFRLLCRGWDEK